LRSYRELAISQESDLVFGRCCHPVTVGHDLTIGSGTVFPELNFTLPPMVVDASSMPRVREEYRQIIDGACKRADALHLPGLVAEVELVPELTLEPRWGAEVVDIVRGRLDRLHAETGMACALRATVADVRDFVRPPLLHSGHSWDSMLDSFDRCAQAGADMLAIESTGGKELNDEALLRGDLRGVVLSLGILAPCDMAVLWQAVTAIANARGAVPSGDSACGFANTAMVLAESRQLPRVWAALVRVMAAVRSLVAFEHGAIGPSKDCAYEGPFLKAITGCPISMEGAEAACGHLSSVGNIARAAADLWSNESVQNVKLLGGMAPTVSLEQLAYATRLMNVAGSNGDAKLLRDWFVESDAYLDVQAFVLRPDVVVRLAGEIVSEQTPYRRVRRVTLATLQLLRETRSSGSLAFSRPESRWLDRLSREADALPEDEERLVGEMLPTLDTTRLRPEEYGLISAPS
jgi:methanol--5-hydroxybenzimidazolylcobamide Co-methyltransferase